MGRCCAVFLTAAHLATTRKGGLGPKSPQLLRMGSERESGGWCSCEGGRSGYPQHWFLWSEQLPHKSHFLSQVNRWRVRKEKETTPLLAKGQGFGGEGQDFEIKYAEEKPVRGKTSSKTCPFSLLQ